MGTRRPTGTITRGTTNPNRLRRVDRWIAGVHGPRLLATREAPVVVDLGYGASPVTALELHERLARVRPDVRVVGVEIDPERVAAGRVLERPGVRFVRGGFEVPVPGRVRVIRALNVLRQYDEGDVAPAWELMRSRLDGHGLLVDGTCNEVGRLAAWVALTREGPVTLTLSYRLAGLERPGVVAERLPKALIHRNVPGERVHDLITALDAAWAHQAAHAAYGARQRFLATARQLARDFPVVGGPERWRLGELTLRWDCVAPATGDLAP